MMTREEASFYLANMDRKYMEEGMSEALDMAIKALEQEPEWIPVSERLPEDKTYVLTTIKVPNRIAHARSPMGDTSGWENWQGWDTRIRKGAED